MRLLRLSIGSKVKAGHHFEERFNPNTNMYSDSNTPNELIFKFVLDNLKHVESQHSRKLVCEAASYLIQDRSLSKVLISVGKSIRTGSEGKSSTSNGEETYEAPRVGEVH